MTLRNQPIDDPRKLKQALAKHKKGKVAAALKGKVRGKEPEVESKAEPKLSPEEQRRIDEDFFWCTV